METTVAEPMEMYAFVCYNNYRKENTFKIEYISADLEEAKRAAAVAAKKEIPRFQESCKYYVDASAASAGQVKINTRVREHNIFPANTIIVEYNLVFVSVNVDECDEDCPPEYEIQCEDCMVYSVVKLPPAADVGQDMIDESLLIDV